MTTTNELKLLAEELTIVMPPPVAVSQQNKMVSGTAIWTVEPIGSGAYALRISYMKTDGSWESLRPEKEISGFPNTLRQSLEFMISVHLSTKHTWLPV